MKTFRFLLFMFSVTLIVLSCSKSSPQTSSYTTQPSPNDGIPIHTARSVQAIVTKVVDGDTLKVTFNDNSTDTIRILGIDTPETHAANKPNEYAEITDLDCLKTWGNRATEFAFNTLNRREVTIESDPIAPERGYFDRLLAYVRINGNDFGSLLLEKGLARVYEEGDSSRKQDYFQMERKAKESVIGLWGCSSN